MKNFNSPLALIKCKTTINRIAHCNRTSLSCKQLKSGYRRRRHMYGWSLREHHQDGRERSRLYREIMPTTSLPLALLQHQVDIYRGFGYLTEWVGLNEWSTRRDESAGVNRGSGWCLPEVGKRVDNGELHQWGLNWLIIQQIDVSFYWFCGYTVLLCISNFHKIFGSHQLLPILTFWLICLSKHCSLLRVF